MPYQWEGETLKFNLVWNKLTKLEISISLDIRLCLNCQFCYKLSSWRKFYPYQLVWNHIFASCISTWYLISKLLGDCFPHQTNNSWLFFSNLQNTIAGSHKVKVQWQKHAQGITHEKILSLHLQLKKNTSNLIQQTNTSSVMTVVDLR